MNKYEKPTGTLTTISLKPTGEEKPNVQFGYIPQTFFYQTRGQVSVAMNSDPIKAYKQVNNQQWFNKK